MIIITNIPAEQFALFLQKQGACEESLEFVYGRDLKSAWEQLGRFSWLKWLLLELDGEAGFPTWSDWLRATEPLKLEYVKACEAAWSLRETTCDAAYKLHEEWCAANHLKTWHSSESKKDYDAVCEAASFECDQAISLARAKRVAALKALVTFVEP